jgi:hypothetical protein
LAETSVNTNINVGRSKAQLPSFHNVVKQKLAFAAIRD